MSMPSTTVQTDERLSRGEVFSYGFGSFSFAMLSAVMNSFLLIYLTNVVMLDIAVVSSIIAVSQVINGISDLIVGNMIDRTHSRFGKARVWMLRMGIPFALSSVLLFYVPPALPDAAKYVYAFVLYNLAQAVFATFLMIAHGSLLVLITDSRREQTRLSIMSAFMVTPVNIAIATGFIVLLNLFTSEPGQPQTQQAYLCAVAVVSIVSVAASLVTFFFTKERVHDEKQTRHGSLRDNLTDFFATFKYLLKNKYWLLLIGTTLLHWIAIGFEITSTSYFATYVLKDFNAMALLNLLPAISTVLTQIFLPVILRKFGKRKVLLFSLSWMIIIKTAEFFVYLNRPLLLAVLLLKGIGTGILPAVMMNLTADTILYTRRTQGISAAGMINAGRSAVTKLAHGLSASIIGIALSMAGFNAALTVQPAVITDTVRTYFSLVPAGIETITLTIVFVFYHLEEELDKMQGVGS